ncbi:MAG: hypothetical protein ACXIU8_10500 [Alkalilacustris sp.]
MADRTRRPGAAARGPRAALAALAAGALIVQAAGAQEDPGPVPRPAPPAAPDGSVTGPAGAPLSAIDWLQETMPDRQGPAPPRSDVPVPPPPAGEITVSPLDAPDFDAIGLLPAERAGLPRDMWGMTPAPALAEALAQLGPETLPALQRLILAILVAELAPPVDAQGRGALFEVRLDRLIAFGALDPALALLEAAGPDATPALFARWFDLLLWRGDAAVACDRLRAAPELARDPGAQIYCAARAGDWDDAEARLAAPEAEALPAALRQALERFLDPEAGYAPSLSGAEGGAEASGSALMWQILDTLGEGGPTAQLPLAFAHAEMGSSAGWRARLEAAERLARAGTLTPNRLLGLYTGRAPAASGGVWERVAAVQALDTALLDTPAEDLGARLAQTLPRAWSAMAEAELEAPFVALMADRLPPPAELPPEVADLAWRMALLAGESPPAPPPLPGARVRDAFLAALATGTLRPETPVPPGAMPAAILDGMTGPPDPDTARRLSEARRGEVLLRALVLLQGEGMADPRIVATALAMLRAAGQEETARRAALEILLLDRRG